MLKFNWNNWNNWNRWFDLIISPSFPYKARESSADLVAHSECEAIDAEAGTCLNGLDVQAEGSIVSKCDREEFAAVHLRITLGSGWRDGFDERVVTIVGTKLFTWNFSPQNPWIVFSRLQEHIVLHMGLQVDA